jgi:hypothetical protein
MQNRKEKAKRLLKDLKRSVSKRPSPFSGMSEQDVIKHLRKTRETLWEKKLAARP